MTNFAAFGAGFLGTALGSYAPIRFAESRYNRNRPISFAPYTPKDIMHLSARYVAIDLASWSAAMSVSHVFAKKGASGRAEMTDFLFIATATGLIFSYVFFNWLTRPLDITTSDMSGTFYNWKRRCCINSCR